ncbi:MAG: DUF2098 domain-containing protein [Methanofollis sp.]|uniref:DUF2098 domain-containing protein n=1 Tax=Methanofollis sp. TaxID=2052835 RepID=UPI00262F292E|nr:DUF2098 domain-containing protein [Methanofollis sp.]MDD4255276.1 DUF2098 domain-containing protein [Methanofollis sp.]
METAEIVVGMAVRYPRTGTAGTVARIEEVRGETFAEIDTTGLLYRVDTLEPAAQPGRTREEREESADDLIRREKEFGKDLGEAWKNIDNACEGGG